ncbi:hydrolase 1, exosortase A system-associated, partial [Noviherbaspirillum denitrificans]
TAVMRFDYRGMGDSDGEARTFETVQDDIRHAIDCFQAEVPAIKEVVLWGLCDAASASLFYAHGDDRVSGVVLLNPWVRTEEGMAKAYLRHYYLSRLADKELWKKILAGRFDFGSALRSLGGMLCKAAARKPEPAPSAPGSAPSAEVPALTPLPERMYDGLARFKGKVLLIISGNDLTAKEFLDLVAGSRKWQKALAAERIVRRDLPEANHTFARRDWRDQVTNWTMDWITSW